MGKMIDADSVVRAFDLYADHHNNCAGHGLSDQCSCGLLDARRAMLSASAPAPSVPDVVREWQTHDRGSWTYERLHGFADCMAAALTAQVKTIEEMERERDDARKIVALDEVASILYTELVENIDAIDSVDGSSNWWMFRDKAAKYLIQQFRVSREAKEAAETTATELRAEVLGVREEYALCRTLLMERTAEVERLTGDYARVFGKLHAEQARATTAESSLETARGALEEMRADHLTVYTYLKPLIRKLQVSGTAENLSAGWELRTEAVAVIDLALLHAGNHITTEERKAVRESALTALPSPPIRKIKGEG